MRTLIAAAAAATLGLAAEASATTYTYNTDGPGRGDQSAGTYEGLRFTFDDGTNGGNELINDPTLSVSGSVRLNMDAGMINGGWFALTPGGDPRATTEQIAIFYMDFTSGRVSAYRYNGTLGVNGIRTYEDQTLFIESFAGAVETSVSDDVLTFDIDALNLSLVQTASEATGYTGASFGDQIGIWLHLTVLRTVEFDEDGRVLNFRTGPLASFDLPRADAGAVPLPGAALFALTGFAGVAAVRKARR